MDRSIHPHLGRWTRWRWCPPPRPSSPLFLIAFIFLFDLGLFTSWTSHCSISIWIAWFSFTFVDADGSIAPNVWSQLANNLLIKTNSQRITRESLWAHCYTLCCPSVNPGELQDSWIHWTEAEVSAASQGRLLHAMLEVQNSFFHLPPVAFVLVTVEKGLISRKHRTLPSGPC